MQALGSQTQITQAFGQEAPKAVGDYAKEKTKPYEYAQMVEGQLNDALTKTTDPEQRQAILSNLAKVQAYKQQHEQDYNNWKEGGAYRVAAHTAIGALGGGTVQSALTAGGTAVAAPMITEVEKKIADNLAKQGIDATTAGSIANSLTGLTLTGIGASAGLDMSSMATAVNIDANNRQLHPKEQDLAKILYEKAKKQGLVRSDGKPYTLEQIKDALRLANSKKYNETYMSNTSATINTSNSKNPEKYLFDGAIGKSYNQYEKLWIQSPHPGYVTFLQNLSSLDIPDTNLVSFIQKNAATYGYTWEKYYIKPYKEPKIISTTPKPRTNAQYYSQGDLDARNSAVVKGGGGVDLRSGKERQADSDKPMQEKVVPVIQGGVGLTEIYGGTIICTSGIGCTLGGIAIVNGTDNVATAKKNYNKGAKDQVPSAALEAADVSKSTASKVKIVTDIVSGGSIAAGSRVANATKAANEARLAEQAEIKASYINNNISRDDSNFFLETYTVLRDRAAEIRTHSPDLYENGKPLSNVATATIRIDGQLPQNVQSVSMYGNPNNGQVFQNGYKNLNRSQLIRDGYVALDNSQPILKPVNSPTSNIERANDTEYKILENFAQQHKDNTNISGSIDIFTERPPCKSCSNVIQKQFSQIYPNMQIRVYHDNANFSIFQNGKVVSQPMGNIINPAKFPTAPSLEYQGGKK